MATANNTHQQSEHPTLERNFMSSMSLTSMNPGMRPKNRGPPSEVAEAQHRDESTATARGRTVDASSAAHASSSNSKSP